MAFTSYYDRAAWCSAARAAGLVVRVDVDGGLLAFDGAVVSGVWAPRPGENGGWLFV